MSSSKGNSPHKRHTRKQKLLIGLLIFIIIDVALFMFTVTRYTGYDLIKSEKYVEFRMPKERTLTEQEWQVLVHRFYQTIIDAFWDKVSRKSCLTRT